MRASRASASVEKCSAAEQARRDAFAEQVHAVALDHRLDGRTHTVQVPTALLSKARRLLKSAEAIRGALVAKYDIPPANGARPPAKAAKNRAKSKQR